VSGAFIIGVGQGRDGTKRLLIGLTADAVNELLAGYALTQAATSPELQSLGVAVLELVYEDTIDEIVARVNARPDTSGVEVRDFR
jgi:hypothetical protein